MVVIYKPSHSFISIALFFYHNDFKVNAPHLPIEVNPNHEELENIACKISE